MQMPKFREQRASIVTEEKAQDPGEIRGLESIKFLQMIKLLLVSRKVYRIAAISIPVVLLLLVPFEEYIGKNSALRIDIGLLATSAGIAIALFFPQQTMKSKSSFMAREKRKKTAETVQKSNVSEYKSTVAILYACNHVTRLSAKDVQQLVGFTVQNQDQIKLKIMCQNCRSAYKENEKVRQEPKPIYKRKHIKISIPAPIVGLIITMFFGPSVIADPLSVISDPIKDKVCGLLNSNDLSKMSVGEMAGEQNLPGGMDISALSEGTSIPGMNSGSELSRNLPGVGGDTQGIQGLASFCK